MRRTLIALAAATALAAPAMAQSADAPAGVYAVDKTHASLTWKVMHQGLSWYTARFKTYDAEINFDPKNVENSSVTATINVDTLETDFEAQRPADSTTDFNAELIEEERFFNGGAHPTITFASTSVEKTGDTTGKVTGDLTFLGVTKPITLDVTYIGDRNDPRAGKHKVGFSATGTVKRSEWGFVWGDPFIGDDVQLQIEAEFVQK